MLVILTVTEPGLMDTCQETEHWLILFRISVN